MTRKWLNNNNGAEQGGSRVCVWIDNEAELLLNITLLEYKVINRKKMPSANSGLRRGGRVDVRLSGQRLSNCRCSVPACS